MNEHQPAPFEIDPQGPSGSADSFDRPPSFKTYPGVAWTVIIILSIVAIALHSIDLSPSKQPAEQKSDGVDLILMELQGKYLVGLASVMGNRAQLYAQITELNTGTIGQRHRFIVLSAELKGPAEAAENLRKLHALLEDEDGKSRRVEMTPEQQTVHHALRKIYDVDSGNEQQAVAQSIDRIASLPGDERSLLITQLGWFGELALAPEGGDHVRRQDVIASASLAVFIIVGVVGLVALMGLGGFVGWIVVLVLAIQRQVRLSNLATLAAPHGVYAETFAVWMLLFLLMQVAGAMAAGLLPSLGMVVVIAAFFASLSALAWPLMRDIRWNQVGRDVGLAIRRNPLSDIAVGVGGYCMALPLVAVGFIVTYVLILLQQALQPDRGLFDPAGGPAHPVIVELAGDRLLPKLLVLALGAIAAPIVEEVMFRGVLYRHLRGATAMLGVVGSVIISALVSSFIFAAIHPQGWVAIPALASLALAFALMREWRGTVWPCMVMHGISNFIVLGTLIALLSV